MQEAVFGADLSGNLDKILIHLNIQLGLRFEAKDCQENYLVLRLTRESCCQSREVKEDFRLELSLLVTWVMDTTEKRSGLGVK